MKNSLKINTKPQIPNVMTATEFNHQLSGTRNLLFSYALRLTSDREAAKDLMQETLMRAFASRENFELGTNFKAWATTIMRNSFINNYRKKRTRNRVEMPLDRLKPGTMLPISNLAYSQIMGAELRLLLNDLNDAHRIPLEMFVDGFEYLEIAEELDIPMGTVKSRIFFAR